MYRSMNISLVNERQKDLYNASIPSNRLSLCLDHSQNVEVEVVVVYNDLIIMGSWETERHIAQAVQIFMGICVNGFTIDLRPVSFCNKAVCALHIFLLLSGGRYRR